jgi:tetratricopeptide (TPR) repeat protein
LRRYDDALALFSDQLNRTTLWRLAAYRERIAWLEQLFPRGTAELPALTSDRDQRFTLNALALSYQYSGQPSHAMEFFRGAIEIGERQHDDSDQEVYFSNLSEALCETGALREAEIAARHALVRTPIEDFGKGISLHHLGRALILRGDDSLGHLSLSRSQRIFMKGCHLQLTGAASGTLADRSLRLGDLANAGGLADKAWELASNGKLERNFIRAALLQGRVGIGQSNLPRADERLHHALTRARAVNLVEFELQALIAVAKLELARNRTAEAKSRLDDVWEAAERGPYRLYQADAYNVLADIALAEGDKPAAIDAATKAYRVAWCDGPPYAYHWGLVKAKAHLAALRTPEPDMPPFDESKFEPMPEVDINPKDEYWIDPNSVFELRT